MENYMNMKSLCGAKMEIKNNFLLYYTVNSTNMRWLLPVCAPLKEWKLYIAGIDALYLNTDS